MSILHLAEVNAESIDLAGGKGANLGELLALDFPVPPGFVVCADEYAAFIEQFDIPANADIPDDPLAFLETTRNRILNTALSDELLAAITQHHNAISPEFPDTVYAVRSSATAEDLADASFAGQHDTYYYVTEATIAEMVRKCWASLWSESAFSYRQTQGIEHRSVYMAVVVQVMVKSDVSGVTFTADPVSGSDTVIITEASWGMGAAIVDGRVSPDQFLVDKPSGRLTSIKISDKKFMVPPAIESGSARLMEVPAHQRRAESLNDAQVEEIAALGVKAEAHFGRPQDLEWAIQDNYLYLLQSRPITVLGEQEEAVPQGRYILFKPIVENFTDPLKPLTENILANLVPMMTIIYGRVYMNFDHVRALIPLKMSDADIARLAYLSAPEDGRRRISLPRVLMLGMLLFGNYLTMGVFNRRTSNMPDDFMASYRNHVQDIVDDDRIPASEAMVHLFLKYRFFEPAGNMVMLINLVAPRYIALLSMLRVALNRWAPDLPEDTASLLCAGSDGVLSTEMGRNILALAQTARVDDAVRTLLTNTPPHKVMPLLRANPEAARFVEGIDAFLAMHGHRALKEFELSSVRWDEDPAPVLGMIRNYLLVDTDLSDADASVRQQRDSARKMVEEKLSRLPFETYGNPRRRLVNTLIHQTRYYMKLRENSRFYHIMGFYAVRKKVLKVERQLLDQGILKCKDDIFYLHWPEIEQLVSGHAGWHDVEEIIRARRMEHIRRAKMVPPRTIGFDVDDMASQSDGEQLKGQGASPGQFEGVARVIMDPATDNEIEPGEILVAPYTDPAWTPLFLTANAAVVEVGSYLSHAGTIAREYGMPCVVDVNGCTSRITTGTRILVNGTDGSVTILTEETE